MRKDIKYNPVYNLSIKKKKKKNKKRKNQQSKALRREFKSKCRYKMIRAVNALDTLRQDTRPRSETADG